MRENSIPLHVGANALDNQYLIACLQVLGASFFLALCSQIQIPLYFTPVPITLQTLAVTLVGGVLGRKKGALTVLAYLAEIAMGLPFCAGGASNPLALVGPTGGYFIGFIVQAYLVGKYLEKKRHFSSTKVLIMIFLIALVQLAMGIVWLGYYIGWNHALIMGFYPFIPGCIIKCIVATALLVKWRGISHEKDFNLC